MTVSFRWFVLVVLLISTTGLYAQIPGSATLPLPVDQLERYVLPVQDNERLLAQEMEQRQAGRAPRFATPIPVSVTPATAGRWDIFGTVAVWRFRLYSAGARSLNLGFTQYQMPEGGTLYIYDPKKDLREGPFTPADNESHNQLWTPVFPGDELIIEIRVPAAKKSKLNIELSVVNHDFLGLGERSSGSCNLDFICGTSNGWDMVEPFRDAGRSVGVFSVNGTLLCTGFLVNNTRQDCTPYFMTADHCEISPQNAASVVVYWNYENSTCREPDSFASGSEGDGLFDEFNTGAIFRSSWNDSDFCLVELDDPVNEAANAFFAGWSAENTVPEGMVASIHHPLTEEKRISFSEDVTHFSFWGSREPSAEGNHLIVNSWSVGTTQSGSSGAALFNAQGQVIGQLHGGDAACGNDSYDSFGRLYNSWEGGGTADSRLKDWLDPIGLGLLSMEGRATDRCDLSVNGIFTSGSICAGDRDTLRFELGAGFESVPEITTGNIPSDLHILLESIPDDADGSPRMVWITSADTPPGLQHFPIYFSYDGQVDSSYATLNILSGAPETPELLTPGDQTSDHTLKIFFDWEASGQAELYYFQLATDPDFLNLVEDREVSSINNIVISDLLASTTYYWRVAAENICGLSDWSTPASFITSDVQCATAVVGDTPIEISALAANTISSEIALDLSGTIASIEVSDLDIEHNWIGDLSVILRSPGGTEVALMDRPGFPSSLFGCDGSDLLLTFNEDFGASQQQLESTCSSISPSLTGTYQPLESLEALVGEPAGGTWTLIVKDQADEDGGSLISWSLNICTVPEVVPLLSGVNDAYTICREDTLGLTLVLSDAFTEEVVTLGWGEQPAGASATFSKNPAAPGDTVYLTVYDFSASGNFTPEITAMDGTDSNAFPFSLEVQDTPGVVVTETPSEGAGISTTDLAFSWTDVGATQYRLEIADDQAFSNILRMETVNSNAVTLELPSQNATFFWRVIAVNDCGESISNVSSFVLSTSATTRFPDGQEVQVFPNPFSDAFYLEFHQPLETDVNIRLLDINGRTLYTGFMARGSTRQQITPESISAGIYLLEFYYRGQRHYQRLLKGG